VATQFEDALEFGDDRRHVRLPFGLFAQLLDLDSFPVDPVETAPQPVVGLVVDDIEERRGDRLEPDVCQQGDASKGHQERDGERAIGRGRGGRRLTRQPVGGGGRRCDGTIWCRLSRYATHVLRPFSCDHEPVQGWRAHDLVILGCVGLRISAGATEKQC
jgi:hypothetical protein